MSDNIGPDGLRDDERELRARMIRRGISDWEALLLDRLIEARHELAPLAARAAAVQHWNVLRRQLFELRGDPVAQAPIAKELLALGRKWDLDPATDAVARPHLPEHLADEPRGRKS
mgnify:CR=1 FL=1